MKVLLLGAGLQDCDSVGYGVNKNIDKFTIADYDFKAQAVSDLCNQNMETDQHPFCDVNDFNSMVELSKILM